jgi:hypothetical protein
MPYAIVYYARCWLMLSNTQSGKSLEARGKPDDRGYVTSLVCRTV